MVRFYQKGNLSNLQSYYNSQVASNLLVLTPLMNHPQNWNLQMEGWLH